MKVIGYLKFKKCFNKTWYTLQELFDIAYNSKNSTMYKQGYCDAICDCYDVLESLREAAESATIDTAREV